MKKKTQKTILPSGTTGAMSELMISADLMKHGYDVFRALSPSCYCDIIATRSDGSLRIEVRTGYRNQSGKVGFPKNTNGDIDAFAVYIREDNSIHYFNTDVQQIDIY
jgi:Holliday junction resolvase